MYKTNGMKYIFFLWALLTHISLSAQIVTLSGYVADAVSGEAVIGANIMNVKSATGVSTNQFGYFSMRVNVNETNSVRFSCIGYKTLEMNVRFQNDTLITFE